MLRSLPSLRKKLTAPILSAVLAVVAKGQHPINYSIHVLHTFLAGGSNAFAKYLNAGTMDTTADVSVGDAVKKTDIVPEAQNYIIMLLVVFLIDAGRHAEAVEVATELFRRIRDNKHITSEQVHFVRTKLR